MNLTEVILEEGKKLHCSEAITLEELAFPFGTYPITKKSPLELDVTNEGDKKLKLEGSICLEAEVPCDRCLDPVAVPLDINFDLELDMKLSDEERHEALDESDYLHGYNLDVDKLVYGEALLAWPARVLCRDDCAGLCKICGQNLNRKTCDCDRTDLDPRMAKIRDIFSMYKEV